MFPPQAKTGADFEKKIKIFFKETDRVHGEDATKFVVLDGLDGLSPHAQQGIYHNMISRGAAFGSGDVDRRSRGAGRSRAPATGTAGGRARRRSRRRGFRSARGSGRARRVRTDAAGTTSTWAFCLRR